MQNDDLFFGAVKSGSSEQSIGEAGGQGFGVGVYGGDESELTAIGLSPMDGCDDPASDNYGNYIHTNGSIMCFIPAFAYRIGNAAAPSYSRDGANALEISSATNFSGYEAGASFSGDASLGDGWILHRAFVNAGVVKRGFFIDKYLCSKSGTKAVSVKNGDPISLSSSYNTSSGIDGGSGYIYDALTISQARGSAYQCVSGPQWSAISMLGLAHGQAATSTDYCAWYDPNHATNFPRGNTNDLTDAHDSSVTFVQAGSSCPSGCAKTGSCSVFAKSTHNGQNCGVTDVAGNLRQPLAGVSMNSAGYVSVFKPSLDIRSINSGNYTYSSSNYDSATTSATGTATYYWGANAFHTGTSGADWGITGIIPKTNQSSGTALFGSDYCYYRFSTSRATYAAGYWGDGTNGGLFCRSSSNAWGRSSNGSCGFRAAGYAG